MNKGDSLLQMYNFLIPKFTHTVLCHNTVSVLSNFRSFSLISNTNYHEDDSFTVSTLVISCGLSPKTTLKLLNSLKRRHPNAQNAVIQFLRNYGFSDSQLCIYVKKHPFVLLAKPEKTLLPKLNFLLSIGISTTDLPKILIRNPYFLKGSLEKSIIPRYEVIRSFVRNDKEVVATMKRGSWASYNGWTVNDAVQNIDVLRKLGVPQGCISLLVSNFTNVAFANHSSFVKAVNSVNEMGFDPSMSNFVLALQVIAKMDKETLESRFKIFEGWGWSRDLCLLTFHKYPQYVMISEKKIMKTMNFLVNDVGLTHEDIARWPGILNRNLEKTLIPRWAVVKILNSKGLIKSDFRMTTAISISEKMFLERFVIRFEKDALLLLDAYKGRMSD